MSPESNEDRLAARIRSLSPDRQRLLEQLIDALGGGSAEQIQLPASVPLLEVFDWPHAPLHRISEHGTYLVTAATLHKKHFFKGRDRLNRLVSEILQTCSESGWQLEAWAVFSNRYHAVMHSAPDAVSLRSVLGKIHGNTAREINQIDDAPERQVWFNFRETRLTFEKSYMARLNYVHQNAVKHGLVRVASHYPWCSAGWFERTATRAQVKTIYNFKIDKLKIDDDFDVEM